MPAKGHTLITVRPATAQDQAALQSIYARCVSLADWLPPSAKHRPVFAEVSQGEHVQVAMSPSGEVLGLVSVQAAEPFVHHLYVRPEDQGRAVGQALLGSLEAWLPQPWHLKCVRRNAGGLRFYRRCGWTEVGGGESEHGPYALLRFRSAIER